MKKSIYVVTHKKISLKNSNPYKIILVGAYNKKDIPNNYLKDCEGENISFKNDSYCELTGLYWIWKNVSDDVVGLVHYRRFFVNLKKCFEYRGRYILPDKKGAYSILSDKDVDKLMQNCDIIVKSSEKRRMDNRAVFTTYLGKDFCCLVENIFKKMYPEYVDEFDFVMAQHTHINCNMFIGRKSIVDSYCEWLFPVLEQVDNYHRDECGERYHNREIGYIGEMLFEIWLRKNKVNYQIQPVVNIDDCYAVNGVMNYGEFIKFFIKKVFCKMVKKG